MYPDFDGDREVTARASLADHVCYQLRVLDQMGTVALSHCPPVCVCVCEGDGTLTYLKVASL